MPKVKLERVGVVARSASDEAVQTATELADWLGRRSIQVELDEKTSGAAGLENLPTFDPAEPYDLVVVLGGDGTLLSAARSVAEGVPLLGVNMGRLGFLTEVSRRELYPTLVQVLSGSFLFEDRSLFEVRLQHADGGKTLFRSFNDVVIAKSALARIIELTVRVDQHLVGHFRADGLIVSTPSGSTAYNLSAGGPILHPGLQVAVLTPICPHTLSMRPIVVPDSGEIEISLDTEGEEVVLTVDGQEGDQMGPGDRVIVQRAKSPVRLVRMRGRTFYDALREKLKWGS